MNRTGLVTGAMLLDLLIGDPPSLPHPVRAMGWMIECGEPIARQAFPRTPQGERQAGIALVALLVCTSAVAGAAVVRIFPRGTIILAASTLALRSLLDEVCSVRDALETGDLVNARVRLARIVGRDTQHLDESEIARAAIETLAESACDGVIAPLVYLSLGGIPAALAFKAVSTLDSMIGHIEEPYRHFGWAAARLDDLANYLPARVTAGCIVAAATVLEGRGSDAWETVRTDARKHRSPNAGQSEAAMAGALGVRLGGANRYDDTLVDGALFGAASAPPARADIDRAIRVTALACGLAAIAALACALVIDARR